MPIDVARPGVLSASHSLGRRLGGPLTASFWNGVAADDGWSADLAHNMHATLRLMLEKERHSAEEMSTALARASSLTENGHAGLRACARALYEMSENACCVLCARTARAPTLPLTQNPVHGFGTCSVVAAFDLALTWPCALTQGRRGRVTEHQVCRAAASGHGRGGVPAPGWARAGGRRLLPGLYARPRPGHQRR